MREVAALRQKIIDLLVFELPRKIPLLRTAWDFTVEQFPDMEHIVAGETADEVIGGGGASWAIVTLPRLLRTRPVEIDAAGHMVYLNRYTCMIGVWARSAEWVVVQGHRDRLVAACRLCLLEYPTLQPQVPGDSGYRFVTGTYSEQYGTPVRMANKAITWGGALLAFEVDAEETLTDGSTRTPTGEAETLTTNATAVGPAEPMP